MTANWARCAWAQSRTYSPSRWKKASFHPKTLTLKVDVAKRQIKPLFAMKAGAIIEAQGGCQRWRKLYDFDYEQLRPIEESA
jgi:hypothetical protein